MKRLTSSCAFLFVLSTGITGCGLADVFIPASLTPTLSTIASIPVINTQLRVSFKHPPGWALIDSGTVSKGPFRLPYAIYGLKRQPDAPTLEISYSDSGSQMDPGDEDILVSNEVHDARYRGEHVVEELRERIDGLPAGGIKYTVGRKVGFRLRATQLHQTNYFEWTSDVKYLNQLEQIYRAMLPTIRIEPPPP